MCSAVTQTTRPTTQDLLQSARESLVAWMQDSAPATTPEPNRLDVPIAAESLLAATEKMTVWGFLSALTGLDIDARQSNLEALYHFCSGAAVVTLRVQVPRTAAKLPSICALIPSASVFERELAEMFGIEVVDTPNPDRLFLPDEWPQGSYPLRKDFVEPT